METETMLIELISRLQVLGFQGVAIIDQGGVTKSHYLAMALGRDGKPCDPRNWQTHDTPEAAIDDLCAKCGELLKLKEENATHGG